MDNVIYTKGKEEEARYQCEECGVLWDEMQKRKAVREGKWEHLLFSPFKCFNDEAKPEANKIGFWICELYSPWVSMAQMAVAWTAAEGNPELEQTFFNTRLGLPYEGNVSSYADPEGLMARREKYNPLIVPAQAGLLTSAADVQDDRIEVLTVAWGRGEECWVLDHQVIPLDPSTDTAWEELARIFGRAYQHAGAANLKIGNFATTTDSGGHFTQQAYKFSNKWMRAPHGKRWFAHKGVPGENKPLWVKSEMRFKDKTKLFLVGVDDGKTTIYTRYAIEKPGPGYIHMHDKFDEDAMRQFSAERAEVEYVNGFPKRKWVKARHRRNELLDMLVYNLAVRNSVNVDIEANIKMFNTPPALEKKPISAFEIGQMYK
jgi:phage terminase large subunit GpA-like protein